MKVSSVERIVAFAFFAVGLFTNSVFYIGVATYFAASAAHSAIREKN